MRFRDSGIRYVAKRAAGKLLRIVNSPVCPLYPREVWIEPTTRCNVRCITCAKYGEPPGAGTDMPPEIYERVRRELLPHVGRIWITGLGEPLVSPLFPRIIDDCIALRTRFTYTTNGVLLTEDLLEKTFRHGFGMALSVDGATRETFESIRCGVSWNLMLRKIETIRRVLDRVSPRNFYYSWNIVGMKRNAHELPRMIEMAAEAGARYVTIFNFGVMGRHDDIAHETLSLHPELVREVFPQVVAEARRRRIYLFLPHYDFAVGGEREEPSSIEAGNSNAQALGVCDLPPMESAMRTLPAGERFEPPYAQRCYAPWATFYIRADGDVWPCCMYFPTALGTLREQSFKQIWDGENYRRLRRAIHSGNPPYYCARCNLPTGITAGDETFFTRQKRISR
jgi:radical SAM protein with 4Fe4S-binding SPASM domain